MEIPHGLPLRNVLLLLSLSLGYELTFPRARAPSSRPTLESPWWLVYILSAPLIFADVRPELALAPLLTLFATRFLFETLSAASAHWTVAVSAAPPFALAPPPRRPLHRLNPVLPDLPAAHPAPAPPAPA